MEGGEKERRGEEWRGREGEVRREMRRREEETEEDGPGEGEEVGL